MAARGHSRTGRRPTPLARLRAAVDRLRARLASAGNERQARVDDRRGGEQERPVQALGADDQPAPAATGDSLSEQANAWAGRTAAVAGAATAIVVLVHVLGGVVMWLRFRTAHLPADQAVALMSREQMLGLRLRILVLPAMASGALALGLVWAHNRGIPLVWRRAAEVMFWLVVIALALCLPPRGRARCSGR